MPKISILTTYPLGAEPVIKNRLLPIVDYFLARGYQIDLYQPEGGLYDFGSSRVSITNVRNPNGNRKNFLTRAIKEIVLTCRLYKAYSKSSSDVVLITIPSMFLSFLLPIMKSKVKLLDVRDLTWEYLSNNSFTNRTFKFLFRKSLIQIFKFTDCISVTNDSEYKYISRICCPSKIHMLSNGISLAQFESLKVLKNNRNSNSFNVTYVGNVGLAQDLTTLLNVAKLLPHIKFSIVGGGNDLPRIMRLVSQQKLNNVDVVGRVEWKDVKSYYEKADILYTQLTEEYESAVPSKLYEYLTVGKPIVYAGGQSVSKLLRQFEGVFTIKPSCESELLKVIKAVSSEGISVNANINRKIISEKYIREKLVSSYFDRMSLI